MEGDVDGIDQVEQESVRIMTREQFSKSHPNQTKDLEYLFPFPIPNIVDQRFRA